MSWVTGHQDPLRVESNVLLFPVPTGELSLEEFVAGARSDDVFMDVMIKSLDLTHIVAMIHNRRHSV